MNSSTEGFIDKSISCLNNTADKPTLNDSEQLFCREFSYIPYVYFSLSVLSLLCCLVVFATYYAFPRLKGYSSNIFLTRTFLDFLIALGHITWLPAHKLGTSTHANRYCFALGLYFEFLFVSANLWYGVLAYDLIKAIRNPFGSRANSGITPHIVVWSLSVVAVIVLAATKAADIGPGISMFFFCWISVESHDSSGLNVVERFIILSLFLYYLPQFIIWVFALIINFIAGFVLLTGFPASSETRQHVLKQNTFYVLVLGLETILLLPLWIAQLTISDSSQNHEFLFYTKSSFIIAIFFAIIHSLRGTIDLVVWWVTFSLGPKDFSELWGRCKVKQRNVFSKNSLCVPLMNPEPKKTVNKNLRKDVMYCINYGILDAVRLNAEEESQRKQVGTVRDSFAARIMLKWDEDNHQEETERRFSDTRTEETHVRQIPFQPANNLRDFSFFDIEPTIFGLIRSCLGITLQQYQQSFTIRDEQDVDSSEMLEKFTEGKSGSFFYFTKDFRYIIKTITEEEEKFLRKIAYKYYTHIQKYPDSVIVKFYGLHKVRLARLQKYITVIVMDNLFYNTENLKMHERYDLKGSTIGRRVLKGSQKKANGKCLKDLDLSTTIMIGRDSKENLLEQLQHDVNFLAGLNIMDYSLLLGIHYHRDGSVHQRSMNIDIDGDEITFVDIGGSHKSTPDTFPRSTKNPVTPATLGVPDSRRRTHSSIFSEGAISSLSLEEREEVSGGPHVPWYRLDYGGIRSLSPRHPLNTERPESLSFSVTERNPAFIPNATYYLGVVDILQVYNLNKKFEHFAKTKLLCKDKYGISAIDPVSYGERFMAAMKRIIE